MPIASKKIMKNRGKKIAIILVCVLLIIAAIVGVCIYINKQKYVYELLEISDSEIQYYQLEENGKYGVIDRSGNCIIEAQYASVDIPNPTKAVFIVSTDGKNYKAVDENNVQLFTQYDAVEAISISAISSNIPYEKSVLIYKQSGLYGIMDFEGNKITENIYNSIANIDYKEGNLKVEVNGYYGVINIKGTTIIEAEYESIMADGYYDEDTKYSNAGFVLRIKTNDGYRFGYADKNGKIILDTLYNEVNRITEYEGEDVYLITSSNGRYGVIKNGKEILKNEYIEITFDQTNNLLIVEKDQAEGVVDMDGNNVIPIDYDSITIGGKYINAQKGDEILIFDASGNNIDTDIINYNQVNDTYAIIIDSENNYNIVNNSGNKMLDEIYTYIEYFKDNYFIVTKDGKTGVINASGKEVVELKYNAIQQISGTTALQAIEEDRTDIIDENMNIYEGIEDGNVIKKSTYIKLYSASDVKYYDLTGKETTYKDLFPNNSIYADQKDGKWGLVDSNGNVVVDYEYDMVTEQNENVAGIKKDGKWQIVDTNGNLTTENEYEISWLDVTFLGTYYKTNNSIGNIIYSATI